MTQFQKQWSSGQNFVDVGSNPSTKKEKCYKISVSVEIKISKIEKFPHLGERL